MKVGIIPAAGKAERFGGIFKELLPARDGVSFINHAVDRLRLVCDLVVVVTNKDKAQSHIQNIKGVIFIEQDNELNLLGAVQSALKIEAERYFFTMPDTYMRRDVFIDAPLMGLSLGIFQTYNPERFGCLVDGLIIDKSPHIESPAPAWGVLSWRGEWRSNFFYTDNFTNAINGIIKATGVSTWDIGYYSDMATVKDYIEYMTGEANAQ